MKALTLSHSGLDDTGRPLRVAALVRLSKDTDTTSSPERQRADIAQYAAQQGWAYDPRSSLFEEIDVSGWQPKQKRPGLDALRAELATYDVVLFWKLDRLFRSLRRFLEFVEECHDAGVHLVSVKEAILDTRTPWGMFVAQLLMAIAEIESATTSVRQKSSKEYLATVKGDSISSRVPFGMCRTPRTVLDADGVETIELTGHLEPHPEQSLIVKRMAAEVLAGTSLSDLAVKLNQEGVPSARGGKWAHPTVKGILTNPVLVGHNPFHQDVVRDDDGVPIVMHDPLFTTWEWANLQERLTTKSETSPRRRNERLTTGLVWCGLCGGRLRLGPSSFYCSTHSLTQGCHPNGGSTARLERYIVAWLLEYLSPERLAEARAIRENEQQLLADGDPFLDDRVRIHQQLDRLEADRLDGLYEDTVARARYLKQHRSLTEQLGALEANVTRGLPSSPGLEVVGERPLADIWDGLTVMEQRTILGAVVERIEVTPNPEGKRADPNRYRITPVEAFAA